MDTQPPKKKIQDKYVEVVMISYVYSWMMCLSSFPAFGIFSASFFGGATKEKHVSNVSMLMNRKTILVLKKRRSQEWGSRQLGSPYINGPVNGHSR